MTARLNDRGLTPFLAMEVKERAEALERRGVDVVHLEVGEPDFATPQVVTDAGIAALSGARTHYTHSLGHRELRLAIVEHYAKRYGAAITPDQIVVTSGTSPAFLMIIAALAGPGDEVIISNPHYACYPNFIRFVGATPVEVPVVEAEGFALTAERARARLTPRTRAILVNSPANPTGCVLTGDQLKDLAALGVPLVSDEVYHGLVYEGDEHTLAEYTTEAFVLGGFSKRYAMTGWRLGYAIVPPGAIRTIQTMQQNLFISASDFIQWAGVAALREAQEDCEKMRKVFARRRRVMLDGVRSLGLGVVVEPRGAFYVFANARHLSGDSVALATRILEKAHVGLAPGADFGSEGEGFLRFSYAASEERIEEAIERLRKFLAAGGG